MPTWLINALVVIAVKIGMPWLIQKFPWIPKEIVDVINQLVEQLKNPNVSNSVAKKIALKEVRDICTSGCAPQLKKD